MEWLRCLDGDHVARLEASVCQTGLCNNPVISPHLKANLPSSSGMLTSCHWLSLTCRAVETYEHGGGGGGVCGVYGVAWLGLIRFGSVWCAARLHPPACRSNVQCTANANAASVWGSPEREREREGVHKYECKEAIHQGFEISQQEHTCVRPVGEMMLFARY